MKALALAALLAGTAQAAPVPYSVGLYSPPDTAVYYPTYFFDSVTVCAASGSASLFESGGKGEVTWRGTDFYRSREPRAVEVVFPYRDKRYNIVPPVDPYDPGDEVVFTRDDDTVFATAFDDCVTTEF